MFVLWLLVSLTAMIFGFCGVVQVVETGVLRNWFVWTYLIIISVAIGTERWSEPFSAFSFSLSFGYEGNRLGVNVVGIVLPMAYRQLTRELPPDLSGEVPQVASPGGGPNGV